MLILLKMEHLKCSNSIKMNNDLFSLGLHLLLLTYGDM
jgi:hypothetical protein